MSRIRSLAGRLADGSRLQERYGRGKIQRLEEVEALENRGRAL